MFSDFAVTVTGTRDLDLALIEIVFEEDGFKLVGPMVVTGRNVLDIALDYTVSSVDRIVSVELAFTGFASGAGSSASIAETLAEFPEVALGVFDTPGGTLTRDSASLGLGASSLHITKNILLESVGRGSGGDDDEDDDHGDGEGRGHGRGHGDDEDEDDEDDGKGHGHGRGRHDCHDDCWRHWKRFARNQASGGIAHISVIRQTFVTDPDPIPEPSSAVLVGLGIAGLAVLRRRSG